jgi:hypothetical protein
LHDRSSAVPRSEIPVEQTVELPALEHVTDDSVARRVFRSEGLATPLAERLSQFVDWLGASTGALAAFVADSDGLLLANRHAPEHHVIATVPLAFAEQTVRKYVPSPSEGSTTIELDDTNVLQVIRVETTAGRLVVGLVLSGALSRATCATVRRMLRAGVE